MESAEFFTYRAWGHSFHLETIFVTLATTLIVGIVSFHLGKTFTVVPGRIQSALEMVVDFFNRLAVDMIGPSGREYTAVVVFIFLAVLTFNWIGLLPSDLMVGHFRVMAPPTRDVNTTLACAIFSILVFNYYGIKKKGWRYLGHFIGPVPEIMRSLPPYIAWTALPMAPFFILLNIVEIMARILSLTIRLFCNIMGEHTIAGALVMFTLIVTKMAAGMGVLAYMLPLFVYFLSVLTGAIQAFIFACLTLTYISGAVEEHHEEKPLPATVQPAAVQPATVQPVYCE